MYIYMSRVDEHVLFAAHNLDQRHHTATYIYTHTYIHTDIQTYIHSYIHTYIAANDTQDRADISACVFSFCCRAASRCPSTAGPLRQLAAKDKRMEASLAHVVMALDLREGGGERKSLHAMCNMLGTQCTCFTSTKVHV
jgi:hypothetical protein